ncbi:DNA repair protein RecN [Ammonifex thiophilus]|uniref:DNA repair protein RecN n=1 Tax=Ammonifex thiophilus TaxID=444093 RepID=A0A3D8P4B3_9THEO|nr:DNA repair protein RecN [Ammonifex thiophilus]RDV83992.1 DNA repair protein RecN [Ammonifex thiophilus]
MLLSLEIKDFVLIDHLYLEFGPGLNVLTGETGAGKSALLAALAFALGERASVECIRTGADKAVVEAVFAVEKLPSPLAEAGMEPEEYLVFRREISRQGRSVCRVNGQILPLSLCRQAGGELVEFLGQGEAQELLSPHYQLSLLDRFGGLEERAKELERLYREWREVREELAALEAKREERAWRLDLLRHQIEEIERAALRPGEEEELLQEREWRRRAVELAEAARKTYELLGGEGGAVEGVEEAEVLLSRLARYRPDLEPYLSELRHTASFLKDLADHLRQLAEELEADPARLEAVEERLALIRRICQKYRMSVEELLSFREAARQELSQLEHSEEELEELRKREELLRQAWKEKAQALQVAREEAARQLGQSLLVELARLELPKARFEVAFRPLADDQPRPRGLSEVEFLFSPNPGEPLKPFARVASGGEAARTLLALKSLVAGEKGKTLCLDEVEAGVGGRALEAVAEKLSFLAKSYQLICITHQAVVAARADRHYLISKGVRKGRTYIRVTPLEGEERVEELARLIGGSRDTALLHARHLLAERGKGQ